jgi:hypothetical protein
MLKRVRILHLYLGLLFAPSILFFSFSGVFQLFGLHESQPGNPPPARWIATMAQVHKSQNLDVHEKPRGPARPPSARKTPAAARPDAAPKENLALKWYFCLMAVGLMVTTLLGIYMAFKYNRDRRIIWGLLAAGVVIPLLALFLGA